MTTRQTTRRDRVSLTDEGSFLIQFDKHDLVSGTDVQSIISYLDDTGVCSIEQIAGKFKLPRAYLKLVLKTLADAGVISHTADFSRIQLVDQRGGDHDGQ